MANMNRIPKSELKKQTERMKSMPKVKITGTAASTPQVSGSMIKSQSKTVAKSKVATKKIKIDGPSNYTPNSKKYQLPMTPAQMQRYNKLASSPKTSDTLFTIPKGTAKLPQKEIDAMQARRVTDRKRTLARAESIIRRTK